MQKEQSCTESIFDEGGRGEGKILCDPGSKNPIMKLWKEMVVLSIMYIFVFQVARAIYYSFPIFTPKLEGKKLIKKIPINILWDLFGNSANPQRKLDKPPIKSD